MTTLDFSHRDITTLRKMVAWYRVAEGGVAPKAVASKPGDNVWSRIVKTPTDGIPAYVDPDPGSADCDLCRKNEDDELEVIDTGVAVVTVWNASLSALAGDEFINAWRDPWGTWWGSPVPGSNGEVFEVVLTKTGGSQGTTTVSPSYTYTVDDIDGNELATGFNPTSTNGSIWVRHIGHMTEATGGIATFRKSDGALKILFCNEQTITEVCS